MTPVGLLPSFPSCHFCALTVGAPKPVVQPRPSPLPPPLPPHAGCCSRLPFHLPYCFCSLLGLTLLLGWLPACLHGSASRFGCGFQSWLCLEKSLTSRGVSFPICKIVTLMSTLGGRLGVGDRGCTELGRGRPRCTPWPSLAVPAVPPLRPGRPILGCRRGFGQWVSDPHRETVCWPPHRGRGAGLLVSQLLSSPFSFDRISHHHPTLLLQLKKKDLLF